MRLLIKNGYLVDPKNKREGQFDILIEGSKIKSVAKDIQESSDNTIDAKDKIIFPGLVDLHVHLRQPGREDKETILSGTLSALKGGITTLVCMPNTQPPMDRKENIRLLKEIIRKDAKVNVFVSGCISLGREGKIPVNVKELKEEGVVFLTDDGNSVDEQDLLIDILKKTKKHSLLVMLHCEDKSLSKDGMINLGYTSTRLGLKGIPKEAEYRRIERDIDLAEKVGTAIHITHISCKESVEIIALAKKRGLKVTCDTCPHYFSLTEEDIQDYNTYMKVNPPLRTKEDLLALKEGLRNGTIDCIASDHAPHTDNEKDLEFDRAEFGTVGLETSLAVSFNELVLTGWLTWPQLIEKMSLNPAKILNLNRGELTEGSIADLVIFDPQKSWKVTKEELVSKGKNSCFLGRTLKGKVEITILGGKIVYKEGRFFNNEVPFNS